MKKIGLLLIILGILIVLGAGLFLLLKFGLPQTVFPYGTDFATLKTSNAISNTYTITVTNENPTSISGGCNVPADQNLNPSIAGYMANMQFVSGTGFVYPGGYNPDYFNDLQQGATSNISSGSINYLGGTIPIISGTCTSSGGSLSCSLLTQSAVVGCYINSYTFIVTMPKAGYCLDSSQCSSNKICQSNQCITSQNQTQNNSNPNYTGSNPAPKSFADSVRDFLSKITSWLSSLFITSQSIVGNSGNITAGQSVSYNINISAPSEINQPGLKTFVFGKWGVLDSNYGVLTSGTVEEITNGQYQKFVSFTAPNNPGSYALVGIITQINETWNPSTNSWIQSPETFISGEGINLVTNAPVYIGINPTPKSFGDSIAAFFQSIINFFRNLFGG